DERPQRASRRDAGITVPIFGSDGRTAAIRKRSPPFLFRDAGNPACQRTDSLRRASPSVTVCCASVEVADRIVCATFPFQPCFFLKENKTKMMPSAAAIAAAVKPTVEISARD